ncbi:hypothetical protein [Holospora curviuscula]|uniref:hypothetical protein n=1 Tax=Holospora curviuscula TaxID=1082868 RepID=UPI000CE59B42|nr:hypothetical protein [Holospora curviuscula]
MKVIEEKINKRKKKQGKPLTKVARWVWNGRIYIAKNGWFWRDILKNFALWKNGWITPEIPSK